MNQGNHFWIFSLKIVCYGSKTWKCCWRSRKKASKKPKKHSWKPQEVAYKWCRTQMSFLKPEGDYCSESRNLRRSNLDVDSILKPLLPWRCLTPNTHPDLSLLSIKTSNVLSTILKKINQTAIPIL